MATRSEFCDFLAAVGIDATSRSTSAIAIQTDDLADFARAAAQCEVLILGYDGLRVEGQVRVPTLEAIADFSSITGSWTERLHASREASIKFAAFLATLPAEQQPDVLDVAITGFSREESG